MLSKTIYAMSTFDINKSMVGSFRGKALHGLSSKRKQMLEDVILLKKLKINETE